MTGPTPLPENEFIDELKRQLEEQPWYRRFANTVTSAVGGVLLIAWLLTTSGVDLPDGVEKGVASAIALLTVLGVLKTKNGLTPRTVEDIESYVGKHRA